MSVVQAAHRFIPAELNDPEWYPFDRESPMYFDVHEYPLHIQSKKDPQRTMSVDGYKALVRKADGERVVPLAVVGDGYKVVQNKELFGKVENMFLRSFTKHELEDVKCHDRMSRYGAYCLREYILPNVNVRIDENSRTLFRLIAFNGFGTTKLKLISGAIDSWCINGMVIGEHEIWYKRHTAGLEIEDAVVEIRKSVIEFPKHAAMLREWKHMLIKDSAHILAFLEKHYSPSCFRS